MAYTSPWKKQKKFSTPHTGEGEYRNYEKKNYFSQYLWGTSGTKSVKIAFETSEVDKNDQEGFLIR